ncbi:hypothetical protein, partial [Shinella sumterensis]|uniref:hypothetical protein n=1 Tax=Shinella sumterensis TaxID=1967501 RepID=UPI003F87F05D
MIISLLIRQINPKRPAPFDFDQVKSRLDGLGFDNSQKALFCRCATLFMLAAPCDSTAALCH